MSEEKSLNDTQPEAEAPKKKSLAEAAKERLAQKKAQASMSHSKQNQPMGGSNQTMKSQLVKKPNNQRRRMGV